MSSTIIIILCNIHTKRRRRYQFFFPLWKNESRIHAIKSSETGGHAYINVSRQVVIKKRILNSTFKLFVKK